jgi:DNA repair protein RecO (recombination protein O)
MSTTLATPLKITDFRESSQVLVLWTREFGKQSVLARGIKKQKNPQPVELFSFYEVEIEFSKYGELHYLKKSHLQEHFRFFRRDLARLYTGYYVLELFLALFEEGDAYPLVFDELLEFFKKLGERPWIKPTLLEFESKLLKLAGFFPHLEDCVLCGKVLEREVCFSASEGGVLCRVCAEGKSSFRLHHQSISAFLQKEPYPSPFPSHLLSELRKMLQLYWTYLLERDLKLFPYIAKMKTP